MFGKTRRLITLLAAAASVLSLAATATAVSAASTTAGAIHIEYRDANNYPVEGAEFRFYKVGNLEPRSGTGEGGSVFSYRYQGIAGIEITPEATAEVLLVKAKEAYADKVPAGGRTYKTATDEDGNSSISQAEKGVYVAEESRAASGYMPCAPFIVEVPRTSEDGSSVEYEVTVRPKPLAGGSLTVRKIARGSEADMDKEFHFRITLDADGTYVWKRSDGKTGTVSSGEEIPLHPDE